MSGIQQDSNASDVDTTDVDTEADRLADVAAVGLFGTAPEERFDRITRLATELFGVPIAAVSLVDSDRQWFKSRQGLDRSGSARRDSICSTTIAGAGPLVVEDLTADDRFTDNLFVTGDDGIRFYAGYPLSGPGGHHVGALCIMDREPHRLGDRERKLLADLAMIVEREMVLDQELAGAAAVQKALLPTEAPAISGWDVAGCCVSDRSVGGDFYDWYPSAGATVSVTVADVMGKGMTAALVTATVRAVLRAGAATPDLAAVMAAASVVLDRDLSATAAFATAFCARLQPDSGRIDYVDAGHGLAFVASPTGELSRLHAGGPPLGALPDSTWDCGRAEVPEGGALLVCSDGMLDAFGGRLSAVDRIARLIDTGRPAEMEARFLAETGALRRPGDDLTVVVARRR